MVLPILSIPRGEHKLLEVLNYQEDLHHNFLPTVCMQLLAALPAGIITDRHRRDVMLRIAATIGLIAGVYLAADVYFTAPIWHFFIAMALVCGSGHFPYLLSVQRARVFIINFYAKEGYCLFQVGTYKGANNPAIESIFADSVKTGSR